FGFNLDRGEVADAARRLARSKHLELVGLHCHIGTYIHQPDAYRESARRLIAAGLDLEKHTGCNIRIYNVGGGFPSRSTLHGQYGGGEDATPPSSSSPRRSRARSSPRSSCARTRTSPS